MSIQDYINILRLKNGTFLVFALFVNSGQAVQDDIGFEYLSDIINFNKMAHFKNDL